MKVIIYISLFLFLTSFLSCRDSSFDVVSNHTEVYDDESNTVEILYSEESEADETPQYNAESGPTVTKISALGGLKVGSAQGLDDCNKYKYSNNRFIVDAIGKIITVQLNRPDMVRSIINASNFFADQVIIENLIQSDSTNIRFTIRAAVDTLQTKTVDVSILSGISLGSIGFPSIKFKLKCVGQLQDENEQKHLYGTSKWNELYWAKRLGKTVSAQTPIAITDSYIPQLADVLVWSDSHTGIIITEPTSVLRNRPRSEGGAQYRQNRFYLSEMNSRCKSEKTIKYIWHKSYDENTLKGANKARGAAKFYYRY